MRSESQIDLPFERYALEFVRHPRARRYVIRVVADGSVRVTMPRWGSKRDAQAFADQEVAWIEKQRRKLREKAQEGREGQEGPNLHELRERARRELPPRLLALAAAHGIPATAITRISIRNQKWRWGSCSRDGHICLNWRLVEMPDAVRDYVLIHELMHLKRMDHSPKFWKLVAQACPDYRDLRRHLRSAMFRA